MDMSEALVPVEARDLLFNAARDPLFFGSGRVFEDDARYRADSAAEDHARSAAVEMADLVLIPCRPSAPDSRRNNR